MLEITDSAVKHFKKLLLEADVKNYGIRIFSSGGGCCASYGLDTSENGEPGDVFIEKDGLKIFVEPAALDALSNASVDYLNSKQKKGFTITGLSSSCCG
jgi:iron-sulfur cluster assembly protein